MQQDPAEVGPFVHQPPDVLLRLGVVRLRCTEIKDPLAVVSHFLGCQHVLQHEVAPFVELLLLGRSQLLRVVAS